MELKNDKEVDAHIEVIEHGPLIIKGNFVLTDLKRGITLTETEIHICRCTRSTNKPFCDDSHKNCR
jgi:CDGSH-type Zn-finger protein